MCCQFVSPSHFHWNLLIHWVLKQHLEIQDDKMNSYSFSKNPKHIIRGFLPEAWANGVLKDKKTSMGMFNESSNFSLPPDSIDLTYLPSLMNEHKV